MTCANPLPRRTLVEHDVITKDNFRDFTFANRCPCGHAEPAVLRGQVVASATEELARAR